MENPSLYFVGWYQWINKNLTLFWIGLLYAVEFGGIASWFYETVGLVRNFHTVKLNSLHVSVFTKTFCWFLHYSLNFRYIFAHIFPLFLFCQRWCKNSQLWRYEIPHPVPCRSRDSLQWSGYLPDKRSCCKPDDSLQTVELVSSSVIHFTFTIKSEVYS